MTHAELIGKVEEFLATKSPDKFDEWYATNRELYGSTLLEFLKFAGIKGTERIEAMSKED
jgi:hypothetical protein